jgi:hypothetical protein
MVAGLACFVRVQPAAPAPCYRRGSFGGVKTGADGTAWILRRPSKPEIEGSNPSPLIILFGLGHGIASGWSLAWVQRETDRTVRRSRTLSISAGPTYYLSTAMGRRFLP